MTDTTTNTDGWIDVPPEDYLGDWYGSSTTNTAQWGDEI